MPACEFRPIRRAEEGVSIRGFTETTRGKKWKNFTGTISPDRRSALWSKKRLFFMTPQTAERDLQNDRFVASTIKCVVVDEVCLVSGFLSFARWSDLFPQWVVTVLCFQAHKATGKYAYVEFVRMLSQQNRQFRVLALSATPGSDPSVGFSLYVISSLLSCFFSIVAVDWTSLIIPLTFVLFFLHCGSRLIDWLNCIALIISLTFVLFFLHYGSRLIDWLNCSDYSLHFFLDFSPLWELIDWLIEALWLFLSSFFDRLSRTCWRICWSRTWKFARKTPLILCSIRINGPSNEPSSAWILS